MNKTIVVIDGDIIAFKAAAANEERSILVTHKASNRVATFKHRTEMKETVDLEKFPLDQFDIIDVQTPADLSFALHTVKMMIQGVVEACEADEYEIYLSGKNNFRDRLPLPQVYKGNRLEMLKPLQLAEVKEYMIKHHGAVVCKGEADDVIATRKYQGYCAKEKVIGASTDKDDMGTVGWLYNLDKSEKPFFVDGLGKLWLDEKGKVRGYGSKWKYAQWIVGDPVDNLKPTFLAGVKYGEKSAYKLLDPLQTDKECWQAVHDLYKTWYPTPLTYVDQTGKEVTANYLDLMQTYFLGIHMQRWEEDFPDVRHVLNKMEIKYEDNFRPC